MGSPGRPTVAYITSHAHSGSTLLDSLIGSHSQVTGVGEAKWFSPARSFNRRCTCDASSVWNCPFWQQVSAAIESEVSLSLRAIDLSHPDEERFKAHNAAFYRAVCKSAGTPLVVDSSKDNKRLARLLQHDQLEVKPIHLVRLPQGVVYSHVRKGRKWFWHSCQYRRRMDRTARILDGRDCVLIRYEELATGTVRVLTELMPWLGVPFEPAQLDWAQARRHNCGGNRMRHTQDSTIRLDEAWREGLTRWQKSVIRLVTGSRRAA